MRPSLRVLGSLTICATVALCVADRARAQVLRSSIDLVHVTVTVRDADGRLIDGLTRDDFEVFEDGKLQTVTQFQDGRVPVSLGILLDVSQSMYGQRMTDAVFALDRFLVDLLEPTDEAFLVVFNHDPTLHDGWTSNPAMLGGRLVDVRPYGATAIYDAMTMAMPLFRTRAHHRAAAVLISDGEDTASDSRVGEVREELRRSDAFVYAIAIDALESRPINDRVNARALRELTDESGGYTEVIRDSPDLVPATERIADELNHQYTIGYTPDHPPDRRYHRIRVRVTKQGVYDVRARPGYTAVEDRWRERSDR